MGRRLLSAVLERYLIEQGAATLAGLKTASLFCLPLEDPDWRAQTAGWDRSLAQKGLRLLPLRCQAGRALLYLYRPSQLQADLDRPGAGELLARYGYESTRAEDALSRLCQRLEEQGGFPHEIGLFLGYPLGDVEGFIRNRGQNCKCAGCWKSIATSWKLKSALPASRSAGRSMPGCGPRGALCGS